MKSIQHTAPLCGAVWSKKIEQKIDRIQTPFRSTPCTCTVYTIHGHFTFSFTVISRFHFTFRFTVVYTVGQFTSRSPHDFTSRFYFGSRFTFHNGVHVTCTRLVHDCDQPLFNTHFACITFQCILTAVSQFQ